MDSEKLGKFNVTLASLMLKSLLKHKEIEQMSIYWPILKEPLIADFQKSESTANKDWMIDTFASSYLLVERNLHPSIHTLKWLLGVIREELVVDNVVRALEIIQFILQNYGESNTSYWMAKAQIEIHQHLFSDAKKSYQQALEYYDELHPEMYQIFRFVMLFFGIEELKSVFASKSHLFDELKSLKNVDDYSSLFEIRNSLKSDPKSYMTYNVNIQRDHHLVINGGAPNPFKSILNTFEILGFSWTQQNFKDLLKNKILYGIDEFAQFLFFTDASIPKEQIRDSAFAKNSSYLQIEEKLYQVPTSAFKNIELPDFRHMYIASPGRVGSTLLHKALRLAGIESVSETWLTFSLGWQKSRGRLSLDEAVALSKLDSALLFDDEVPSVVVKKLPAGASKNLIGILNQDDQVIFLYRNLHDWINSWMRTNLNPEMVINFLIDTLISHSIILKRGFLGGVLWYEDILNSPHEHLERIFGNLRKHEWQIPLEDSQDGTPLSRENLSSEVCKFEKDDYLRLWKASPGPIIARDLGLTRLETPTTTSQTFTGNSFNSLTARVIPANHGGGVDHFYHFLLGLFLPFLASQKEFLLKRKYQFPDVGPMKRHLTWLSELGIEIDMDSENEIESPVGSEICFIGWDNPSAYQFGEFELARDTLLSLMKFTQPSPNLKPRVLIINRSLANYDNRERKTNGTSRRSTPNLSELYSKLSPIVNVELVVLEEMSLKDQIELFSAVDIVVAQHGASLANLVWCRQGALVMEIIDPQLRAPFYEALAHRLSLDYISIPQANNHAEIDIDSVASLILQKCSEETNLL
jgi:hypothetical protein